MLKSHTLQLEQSELREQINGYLNRWKPNLPPKTGPDLDTLTKRGIALELELRASLVSESSSAETRTWKDDGEGREIRQMLSAVSIHDYMFAAVAGKGIEGRAAELNAALEVPIIGGSGGVAIPWAALENRTEHRAFTDTGDPGGRHWASVRSWSASSVRASWMFWASASMLSRQARRNGRLSPAEPR